jgi:sulfatase modifying factor 1
LGCKILLFCIYLLFNPELCANHLTIKSLNSHKLSIYFFITLLFATLSCTKKGAPNAKNPGEASSATGKEFDASDTTYHPDAANGFKPFEPEKEARPNLKLIEGGKSLIGFEEFEVSHTKTKYFSTTVETFYMDETEIANIHWVEYLWHIRKESEQEYTAALPDTLVWVRQFSFNDFYVENYLRHPAFRFYPVVGVSWLQANEYCKWRTDPSVHKVKYVHKPGEGKRIQLSDTEWVYEGYKTKLPEKRKDKPKFRLPTEAEWIYAALTFSYMVPYIDEKDFYRRIYPWDGSGIRNPYAKKRGLFFANFKRGRGDYAGVAGSKNDGAVFTEYIYSYPPNDLGLYNMAGNVNEWVQDLWDHVPQEVDRYEFNRKEAEVQGLINPEDQEKNNFQEYLEEERYRVYKGGSWNDNSHWLSPFTRRSLTEDSSSSTIGFRCAMSAFAQAPPSDKK